MIMLSVTFLVATMASGNWFHDKMMDQVRKAREGIKSGKGGDLTLALDYTKSEADAPVPPSASSDDETDDEVFGSWASAIAIMKESFSYGKKRAPKGGQVSCKDTPDWSDGTNGCVAYAKQEGWCDKYGKTDWNGAGSAADNCCMCGGGTWQSCADTPGWSDGRNGCDMYMKHPQWCDQSNLGATGACCICGGGTKKVVEFDSESEVASIEAENRMLKEANEQLRTALRSLVN